MGHWILGSQMQTGRTPVIRRLQVFLDAGHEFAWPKFYSHANEPEHGLDPGLSYFLHQVVLSVLIGGMAPALICDDNRSIIWLLPLFGAYQKRRKEPRLRQV